MQKKFRLLILPYLVISAVVLFMQATFCWIVYRSQGILEIDEDLTNLWIPFCLPWVPVAIWLRPAIRLLKFKENKRRDPVFAYMLLACIAITPSCIVAATYIESASGKFSALRDIEAITVTTPTKYYTLKEYFIDKRNAGIYYSSYTSGKIGSTLNLIMSVAATIYSSKENKNDLYPAEVTKIGTIENDSSDSATVLTAPGSAPTIVDEEVPPPKSPQAFLCLEFKEEISNNSSADEKAAEEHRFYRESMEKFNDSGLSHFDYLERLPDNEERARFRTAVSKAFSAANLQQVVVLEPKYGDFGKRTGNELYWIFGSYLIGAIVWSILVLTPKIDQEKAALT